MINKDRIKLNEQNYYVPSYDGVTRVKIIKILSDDKLLVKQVSKNKDKEFKPYTIPLIHVFNKAEHARIGKRAWESYMKRRRRNNR